MPRKLLQGTMNEVFFRHFEASTTYRGMDTVEYIKDYEESVQIGYKKIGLEEHVSPLAELFE